MKQYLSLLEHVLQHGARKTDRTGTGTLSVFGHQLRFDLTQGFPLVTTKKVHLKSIIHDVPWSWLRLNASAVARANGFFHFASRT